MNPIHALLLAGATFFAGWLWGGHVARAEERRKHPKWPPEDSAYPR